MAQIRIVDLEVRYCVGVTDGERAHPQRLLLTVEMAADFARAARSDSLTETIDYYAVAQALLAFGKGRSWRLLEKLAWDLADFILTEYRPRAVQVEVKKFVIPQARYVAVSLVKKARPVRVRSGTRR
ncbi:MAG: dihydroneopterin aldolase [Verrucomicrobia bacterium]|jgi:FolB domain-containing protein|nr:dihydroneopterin aldolase [Verrucomicrobiota bacterium]